MTTPVQQTLPDARGYYGRFGGVFVPEVLIEALAQAGVRRCPAYQHFQRLGLYGLFQEPVGAQLMHRSHGRLDIAIGR